MHIRRVSKLQQTYPCSVDGPFQVIERVGDVVYKLKLPLGTRLHDVFHVRLLKKLCSDPPTAPAILAPIHHGWTCLDPEEVVKARLAHGRRDC
jgi:hypothetical protein